MEQNDMLHKLIINTHEFVTELYGYYNREREYVPGQKLYMREAHFIEAIGENENITMSEVAEILGITQGAATQIAERLEKKDLIFKTRDVNDKRRFVVKLTEQGLSLHTKHEELDKRMRKIITENLKDLTKEEIGAVLKFQERYVEIGKIIKLSYID